MPKKLRSLLITIAFAALGAVSLYFAFATKDLSNLILQLKTANYFWVLPIIGSSLLGSSARALRWQLLLQPVAHKPGFAPSFFALMYGYFVNIGTPRVGELTRCISLQETTGIPFTKSFGTVFTERAVDMICLLLCVVLAFALQIDLLSEFFTANIYNPINNKTGGRATMLLIMGIVLGIVGLLVLLYLAKRMHTKNPKNKIIVFFRGIIEGVLSIFKLKNPLLFIVYTVLIWFSYFLTSYLWFFAFEATQNLTVAAAFTVMSVGAIAKSLPIQASGAGVYHILVGQLLGLYAISGISTLAYATLNHGTQMAYNIVLGLIAISYLLLAKRQAIKNQSVY